MKIKQLTLVASALALSTVLLSGQGQSLVDPASLLKPLAESWPTYSGDYTGRRFSALKHVNKTTVKNLSLAWIVRLTAGAGAAGGGGGRGGGGGGAEAGATAAVPNRREVTVTVTLASGEKVEGRLGRIDDFIVILAQADGTTRSFRRDGDLPRIDIRDPLEAHKKLLLLYTDTDMHNVTAYLATLK